jgi:hypothetical protein
MAVPQAGQAPSGNALPCRSGTVTFRLGTLFMVIVRVLGFVEGHDQTAVPQDEFQVNRDVADTRLEAEPSA